LRDKHPFRAPKQARAYGEPFEQRGRTQVVLCHVVAVAAALRADLFDPTDHLALLGADL